MMELLLPRHWQFKFSACQTTFVKPPLRSFNSLYALRRYVIATLEGRYHIPWQRRRERKPFFTCVVPEAKALKLSYFGKVWLQILKFCVQNLNSKRNCWSVSYDVEDEEFACWCCQESWMPLSSQTSRTSPRVECNVIQISSAMHARRTRIQIRERWGSTFRILFANLTFLTFGGWTSR